MMDSEIPYGPVYVKSGKHKGRIANYDDSEDDKMAICYFGDIFMYEVSADIPIKSIRPVNTDDLMRRREQISDKIGSHARHLGRSLPAQQQLDLMHEYHYISNVLMSRWDESQTAIKHRGGKRVFISHSSKNEQLARWISVDLASHGHLPWLDQWQIRVGDSIPSKISEGLDACDVVILLLSPHAVKSGWVEREWQAKYWDEVEAGRIMVLPALLEDCQLPTLLKTKKYADFRFDFNEGLSALSKALQM
jgi:hypothetical protein